MLENWNHLHDNQVHLLRQDEQDIDGQVKQEQNEELPVVKPDTVVDPGTVMIHIQNTLSTSRAMMCALGLEVVADEAVDAGLFGGE